MQDLQDEDLIWDPYFDLLIWEESNDELSWSMTPYHIQGHR